MYALNLTILGIVELVAISADNTTGAAVITQLENSWQVCERCRRKTAAGESNLCTRCYAVLQSS